MGYEVILLDDTSFVCSYFAAYLGPCHGGQQPEQGDPDAPLPIHFHQLLQGDTQMYPSQLRDIILQQVLGLPRALLQDGRARNISLGRRPGGILTRCLNQLAPVSAEEQWLYSVHIPDVHGPQPISKAEPSHPAREAHFGHLYS